MKRFTAISTVLFFLATFTAIPAQAVKNGYSILVSSAQSATDSNTFSLVENSALRNAVIIGLLLFAAIMLVLIYRKKKAVQGSTQTIDAKKLKKFLGKKKKEEEEDDLLSFRCPSCQAPIKTDARTCPRCRRPVK